MRGSSRRRFVVQAIAAVIGSAAVVRTAAGSNDTSNDGLTALCVITRQPGIFSNSIVDVWTGQIGILDFALSPEQLGRVVVWHDVRGAKGLSESIDDILCATEEYFGIRPILGCNAAAHVGHFIGLSSSIDALLKHFESASPDGAERIAVIDLSSCGLTRLDWLDIIPLQRRYYTHVIGVDYSFPSLCELDTEFEPPHGLSRSAWSAMHACDYWLIPSDGSLCGQSEVSIEERATEFTKLIRELCVALANSEGDIHTALAERKFLMFGASA